MAKREVYMSGMKARLVQWNAQLEVLKGTDGDAKQLDAWKVAVIGVADKLAELKAADEKWYVIKAEVEKAGRALETALAQADPAARAEPPPAESKPRPTA
jgi:hypothetical protein